MSDISNEPSNQEVFEKMIGFLIAISNKLSSFKNWSQYEILCHFAKNFIKIGQPQAEWINDSSTC